MDPIHHRRAVIRRLAWVARYARGITLTEALDVGIPFLRTFQEELAEIVREENKRGGSRD